MTLDEALQVEEQLRDARERVHNVREFLANDAEDWSRKIAKLRQIEVLILHQCGEF